MTARNCAVILRLLCGNSAVRAGKMRGFFDYLIEKLKANKKNINNCHDYPLRIYINGHNSTFAIRLLQKQADLFAQ